MKSIKIIILALVAVQLVQAQDLYRKSNDRNSWFSFENRTGKKGAAAQENKAGKGHAFDWIAAGDSCVLLDAEGPDIIDRIWLTVDQRSPEMLRSLVVKMYWDGSAVPAVSVPLGDFFCNGLSKLTVFENCFFSNPEARSFNTTIPMPFRESARIMLVNTSGTDVDHLFYDINMRHIERWENDMLYFHAWYESRNDLPPGEDYVVLPEVRGAGRFLGLSAGIEANGIYGKTWWGEGEIKMYLDGDGKYPTLAGTGVEDYVGTAWGMGAYYTRYQGCPVADEENQEWSFYRFHVPDPVYFSENCRVELQQIGGAAYEEVLELYRANAPLIPVTVDRAALEPRFVRLLDDMPDLKLDDPAFPQGWVNFYRSDTLYSVAYFYLDKPSRT